MPIRRITSPIQLKRPKLQGNRTPINTTNYISANNINELNILQHPQAGNKLKEQIYTFANNLKMIGTKFKIINGKHNASIIELSEKTSNPLRITTFSKKGTVKSQINSDGSSINKFYDKDGRLAHTSTLNKKNQLITQTIYNQDKSKVNCVAFGTLSYRHKVCFAKKQQI